MSTECLQGAAQPYLADEFYQPTEREARRHLCSSYTLSITGDRTFPVADDHVWNGRQVSAFSVFCRCLTRLLILSGANPVADRTVVVAVLVSDTLIVLLLLIIIIIIIIIFAHQHKAAGVKTKQKQRLRRLLIRCSLC